MPDDSDEPKILMSLNSLLARNYREGRTKGFKQGFWTGFACAMSLIAVVFSVTSMILNLYLR